MTSSITSALMIAGLVLGLGGCGSDATDSGVGGLLGAGAGAAIEGGLTGGGQPAAMGSLISGATETERAATQQEAARQEQQQHEQAEADRLAQQRPELIEAAAEIKVDVLPYIVSNEGDKPRSVEIDGCRLIIGWGGFGATETINLSQADRVEPAYGTTVAIEGTSGLYSYWSSITSQGGVIVSKDPWEMKRAHAFLSIAYHDAATRAAQALTKMVSSCKSYR